jgi:SacI-like restriction endonuclease
MVAPDQALAIAFSQASGHLGQPLVEDTGVVANVEYVCRNIQNRAGSRLLLACLLAKIHRPEVDIRKPYTEIGDRDAYSGRTYDETHISAFINQYELPCNPTTAFLTPAFRNRNITLTQDVNLVGRPPKLYQTLLKLLDEVYIGHVKADDLLAETIRWLLIIRNETRHRTETLLATLSSTREGIPLSTEAIVRLVEQHLSQPRSSRLPVLVVAAAYEVVAPLIGEKHLPLFSHNAADRQTESLGDLEVTITSDNQIVTSYEMKTRRVTHEDIDHALHKIRDTGKMVDNYIFITTEPIDDKVQEYASSIYDKTNGIEFVVLDCISFLRHFLHLFHGLRMEFLEAYQSLVLAESNSAVSQPLKEVLLTLRQVAENRE